MSEKGKSMSIVDDEKAANKSDERSLFHRHRSEQSNHDSKSFSGDDDENSYVDEPYIFDISNVSSNSLFDGTSPSIMDSEDRGAGRFIDEYCDSDSGGNPSLPKERIAGFDIILYLSRPRWWQLW